MRQHIPFGQYLTDDVRTLEERPISAQVPFHPDTDIIRMWNGDVLVKEWHRPDVTPEIDQLGFTRSRGVIRFDWRPKRVSQTPLHYVLRVSKDGGKTFHAISELIEEQTCEISERAIPGGGRCIFQVIASDGFHTLSLETDSIDLPASSPQLHIIWPPNGHKSPAGHYLLFSGEPIRFIDDDSSIVDIRWVSDRDGQLAQTASFRTNRLSAGRHRITMYAEDNKGNKLSAEVTVEIFKMDS